MSSGSSLPGDGEIASFKKQLQRLAVELAESIDNAEAGTKPVDLDEPIGRLSRMDAMQQQKMAQATKRGLERRLMLTRAALARIEVGTFGECAECEEPIPRARLRARPESRCCIPCQSAKER